MITDWNQACLAKMTGRRVLEELLFFSKTSRPKVQFDANTYLYSDLLIKTDCRLSIEIK
jgi:hypothetical protein